MELLKAYALSFVGLAYRWGGDDPIDGFDCSGLVQEILASVGLDPKGDQTAQGLYDHFAPISEHGVLQLGTLLFFGKSTREITHVAFALDQYRMLEAGAGGSKTLTRQDAITQNAYARIRPIDNRLDLVAALRPPYKTLKLF